MTAGLPFNIPFLAVVALISIGFIIILTQRNLIKLVMGIVIMESGVNLFLVSVGYRSGGIVPIFTHAPEGAMVLPVPQALTLTSIVIGVATTALMLSLIVLTYRHTGDTDAEKSRILKG